MALVPDISEGLDASSAACLVSLLGLRLTTYDVRVGGLSTTPWLPLSLLVTSP